MTELEKMLRRWDDKTLAQGGEPARYRRRVDELVPAYEALLREGVRNQKALQGTFDALTFVFGNLVDRMPFERAVALVVDVMRREVSDWVRVEAALAVDFARLRSAERTVEGVSHLKARAALRIEILSGKKGFFGRLFDQELSEAKQVFEWARKWLNARYDEDHPETVQYVYVQQQAPYPQYEPVIGCPTYSGL